MALSEKEKQRRISEGLCIRCKKPNSQQTQLCPECLRKQYDSKKEDYARCQKLGICPICRKNLLMGDEKSCPECRAKRSNIVVKNRDRLAYNAYNREYSKRVIKERKENGICTRCGKRKATIGYVTCAKCRQKYRRPGDYSLGKREIRVTNGKCYFCDNDALDGMKVCEKHRQRMVEMSHSPKAVEAREKYRRFLI